MHFCNSNGIPQILRQTGVAIWRKIWCKIRRLIFFWVLSHFTSICFLTLSNSPAPTPSADPCAESKMIYSAGQTSPKVVQTIVFLSFFNFHVFLKWKWLHNFMHFFLCSIFSLCMKQNPKLVNEVGLKFNFLWFPQKFTYLFWSTELPSGYGLKINSWSF